MSVLRGHCVCIGGQSRVVTRCNSQVTDRVCVCVCYCSWVVGVTNIVVVVVLMTIFFQLLQSVMLTNLPLCHKNVICIMNNINVS